MVHKTMSKIYLPQAQLMNYLNVIVVFSPPNPMTRGRDLSLKVITFIISLQGCKGLGQSHFIILRSFYQLPQSTN